MISNLHGEHFELLASKKSSNINALGERFLILFLILKEFKWIIFYLPWFQQE